MTDNERFWLLDVSTDEDTSDNNRINEVCEAANLPMVGLVDESVGGVIAYVTTQNGYADELLSILNRGLDSYGSD